MYIKEAIEKNIITHKTLKDFEEMLNLTLEVNPAALNITIDDKKTTVQKEYEKFLNSEITLEEWDKAYKQFLINAFRYDVGNTINVFKSQKQIISELNEKAQKEGRFAYIYISIKHKDKFDPELMKKTIENIKKDYNIDKLEIKDFEEMPVIGGVTSFPATFIYNKEKISSDPEEVPVEVIIEGYYV